MTNKATRDQRFVLNQLTLFFFGTISLLLSMIYTPVNISGLYKETVKQLLSIIFFVCYYLVAYKLTEYYLGIFLPVLRESLNRHKLMAGLISTSIILSLGIPAFGYQKVAEYLYSGFIGIITTIIALIIGDFILNQGKNAKRLFVQINKKRHKKLTIGKS